MTSLALYVLSLILLAFPPGKTDRSVVLVEKDAPGARWEPCYYGEVREKQSIAKDKDGKPKLTVTRSCKPLRAAAGAWVRTETREEGGERLKIVAAAEADAARAVASAWPEGELDLVRFATSTDGWSGGYQEGMQTGRLRGPAGEGCPADLHPKTLRQFAPKELQHLSDAELSSRVVGLDYDHMRLCFDIGFRAILAARAGAERMCRATHKPIELVTFAVYGTGRYCHTPPPLEWAEEVRYNTLAKFRAHTEPVFPDWFKPPAPTDVALVAEGSS